MEVTIKNQSEWMRLEAHREAPTDVEGDIIKGCSIVTVGEALGHGVHLDESFIAECCEQANTMSLGLKARFGHPQMCSESLGTYLGRFKNFHMSEDGKQLFGDLHIAESAHESPHGDLGAYVAQYAKDDPESFGTSIVFSIGSYYRKDGQGNEVDVEMQFGREDYVDFEGDPEELSEELYVRCDKLMGCDFVDEPAANPSGLFSASTPAGEIAKFLNDNPEVKTLLEGNENVVDIIEKYGVHIRNFLSKGDIMQEDTENVEPEVLESNSDISHENCEESVEEPEALEATEEVNEEVPVEDVVEEVESEVETEEEVDEPVEEPVEAMSATAFRDLVQEFGADISTQVFDSNGSRVDALALQVEALKDENKQIHEAYLKATEKIKDLQKEADEYKSEGVSFSEAPAPKRDITAGLKL